MRSPSDTPRLATGDRAGAAFFAIVATIGGASLVMKGIHGLKEGAVFVTAGSMRAGPLWPVQAIIAGAALFVLGCFAGRTALKKKEPNQPPEPTAPSGRGSS